MYFKVSFCIWSMYLNIDIPTGAFIMICFGGSVSSSVSSILFMCPMYYSPYINNPHIWILILFYNKEIIWQIPCFQLQESPKSIVLYLGIVNFREKCDVNKVCKLLKRHSVSLKYSRLDLLCPFFVKLF